MLCSKCGEPVNVGVMFCENCGSPVSQSTSDSAAPSATPPVAPETPPPTSTEAEYVPPSQVGQGPPPPIVGGAQATNSPTTIVHILYVLSIISSFVAGFMLLVYDFAEWEDYDDYYGTWEYGWVDVGGHILFTIIYLIVIALLLLCIFVSIKGLISKGPLPRSLVRNGLLSAIVAFAIIIVSAVIFFAATAEVDDAWLEDGFFGGAIGSFITILLFGIILISTPKTAPAPPMSALPVPSPQPPMVPQPGQPPYQPPPQQGYQQPASQQQYQPPPQQQYQQPAPQQYQQPPPQTNPCPTCGHPLRFQPEYSKWYCDNCRKYL